MDVIASDKSGQTVLYSDIVHTLQQRMTAAVSETNAAANRKQQLRFQERLQTQFQLQHRLTLFHQQHTLPREEQQQHQSALLDPEHPIHSQFRHREPSLPPFHTVQTLPAEPLRFASPAPEAPTATTAATATAAATAGVTAVDRQEALHQKPSPGEEEEEEERTVSGPKDMNLHFIDRPHPAHVSTLRPAAAQGRRQKSHHPRKPSMTTTVTLTAAEGEKDGRPVDRDGEAAVDEAEEESGLSVPLLEQKLRDFLWKRLHRLLRPYSRKEHCVFVVDAPIQVLRTHNTKSFFITPSSSSSSADDEGNDDDVRHAGDEETELNREASSDTSSLPRRTKTKQRKTTKMMHSFSPGQSFSERKQQNLHRKRLQKLRRRINKFRRRSLDKVKDHSDVSRTEARAGAMDQAGEDDILCIVYSLPDRSFDIVSA